MPVPQALVTRYFQLVASRQFTEAERELNQLKQKMQKTEWNRGYFRALYGMLLSRRSNDNYSFLSKIDLTDIPSLHNYRREFLDHTRNGLHGDFDRGFFSAWADCMRILSRIQTPTSAAPKNASETPTEPHLETLRTDKSQATIANFISSKTDSAEQPKEEGA